ncbi:MAG: radical SAM protein [Candidatus Thermoplasmatota archaeon]
MSDRGSGLKRYERLLERDAMPLYLAAKRVPVYYTGEEGVEALLGANRAGVRRLMESADELSAAAESSPNLIDLKREIASQILRSCRLCERRCGVDRTAGVCGHCRVLEAKIASEFVHLGEEPELVPSYTIFFAGCTFNCIYCQNWDISQDPDAGVAVHPERVASWIRRREGTVRNVNWVGGDPTSNLHFILDVLVRCTSPLPQVWNSNMYLSLEGMALLAGVMDVYLADLKYGNDDCAVELSNAPQYWETVTRNIMIGAETGDLLIRHLVLPGHLDCCSMPVLEWIAAHVPHAKVNVMAQYRPAYRASGKIARRPTMEEISAVRNRAHGLGLDLTY